MQKKRLMYVMGLPMKLIASRIIISAIISFVALSKTAQAQGVMGKLVSINANQTEVKTFLITEEQTRSEKIYIPISGLVINNQTGEPLEGATVTVKGKNRVVTSNNEGRFSIEAEPGDVLVITSVGYENFEVTISQETAYVVKLINKESSLDQVTVIGSRSNKPRSDVSRPVPVDVVSSKELQATGQTDLGQMAQFTSPSFNSAKTGINGVANFADPATLKGMSPDQSLVLINGKRRHQFSAINNNVTIGKGTVVTDLNSIPSLAVERMEILRDGAAAQYGSDAIAGIVNLVLKKTVNEGTFKTQYGVTKEGDGVTFLSALNYGFKLGKPKSFLNFTLHYQNNDGTDRSDNFTGKIYSNNQAKEDSTRNARGVYPVAGGFKVTNYGSNENKAYQAFVNAGYPINDNWTLYTFGGVSRKEISAYGFLRNAIPTDANSNIAIFPDGYTPILPGKTLDYSFVTGLNKKSVNGWNIDLSTGYGYNNLDLYANNTTNPSLGAASPTDFYVGRNSFGQSTTEAVFAKNFKNFLKTKSFNLALGSQLRIDRFRLYEGDLASYKVGPLATTNAKAPGSSGRPGISPSDVTNESRTNIGVFADVETDITDKFLVATALRYENYSDFGSNLSGKLASRYKLGKNFAIRGSINKGFRAPSLQQIFNSQTTSTVQSGLIRQTQQLRSSDPRLAQIGFNEPKAETSWNYNLGLTAKAGNKFLFTLDAYQIDITDRIIISEQLAVGAAIPALVPLFPGIKEITFFTNQINTTTKGVDLVTTFKQNVNKNSNITASLALTFNKTEITNSKPTPAALTAGAANPAAIKIIDTISRSLIETSQPRNKILFSLGYQLNKFNASAKATYFGEVIAWEKPAGLPHRSQTFKGKTLIDLTATYAFSKQFSFTAGANNVTDVYPDKVFSNYASYSGGQIPYTRNANQFGFNGAYYYGSFSINF